MYIEQNSWDVYIALRMKINMKNDVFSTATHMCHESEKEYMPQFSLRPINHGDLGA